MHRATEDTFAFTYSRNLHIIFIFRGRRTLDIHYRAGCVYRFLVIFILLLQSISSPVCANEEASQRKVAKLIPDQKALTGSPPTTFDLKTVFAQVGFKPNTPLNIEILKNNKIAPASIEGTLLTLKWGSKTGKKEIILRATSPSGEFVDTRFYVTSWKPDYWQLALTVLGGLGLFLLGMSHLSEGIQAIAGNRLRRMIGAVTDNRLMATGVGATVTMLVQSSSITTVITVGFVSAGLMTLTQAIGVIMGANIGTTITGWILVLKIGKYGLPILGASAFVYLFSRNDNRRYLALSFMGLGMVFFGLELMKNGFSIVKDLPEFEQWFNTFEATTYFGVLKCAMVGCVLTLLVQSSSATLGITIGLASIGVIPYETAGALVLGENIGTTITAFLASLAAPTDARRAAYFHIIFNVLGVIWVTAIFGFYTSIIRQVVTGDSSGTITPDLSAQAIAATHTGFNVVNTLVFLPLTGFFANLLRKIVPDKKNGPDQDRAKLDVRMLESPIIGIEQSRLELLRMADECKKMMGDLRELLLADGGGKKQFQKILDQEKYLDEVEHEVSSFIAGLLESHAPHDTVDEARRQLRMADEYESVSDALSRVAKAQRRLKKAGLSLPQAKKTQLLALHDRVFEYLNLITESEMLEQEEKMRDTSTLATEIGKTTKDILKSFIDKIPQLDPRIDLAYSRQVQGYRLVRDHLLNIAQAFTGEK